MHSRQTSIRREYLKSPFDYGTESDDEELPSKLRKGKTLANEVENKYEGYFANPQRVFPRPPKEHRVQKEEDVITPLKIRIAVLENELKHSKQEKEAIEKGLGVLLSSMAQTHFPPPQISCECKKSSTPIQAKSTGGKTLEQHIEDLIRENNKLRARNRELDNALLFGVKLDESDTEGSDSNEDKGKEKEVQNTTPSLTSTSLTESWGLAEPLITLATTSNLEHADVGLHSLEDLLGEENVAGVTSTSTSTLTSTSTSSSIKKENPEEVETRSVEEQVSAIQTTKGYLLSTTKPSVLKVGFAPSGSFRGSEYDIEKIAPTYPKGPRRHRDFDRFAQVHDPNIKLGVFDDVEERDGALSKHARVASIPAAGGREKSFPEFFRYGIVYMPSQSETGYLRTVHIGNLPIGIQLRNVLTRVRGGDVLSATLLDTRRLTGTMSCRIVFKTQDAAEAYSHFTASHPIILTAENGEKGLIAEITQMTTPTFPIPVSKLRHLQYTRCLCIPYFPNTRSLSQITYLLSGATPPFDSTPHRKDSLLELWLDEARTLHLHFSSVENAGWAWDVLVRYHFAVECERDPCGGRVEELLGPVEERVGMVPREIEGEEREEGDGRERSGVEGLGKQKVEIPRFSGMVFRGKSWADEVEEEESGGNEQISTSEPCSEARECSEESTSRIEEQHDKKEADDIDIDTDKMDKPSSSASEGKSKELRSEEMEGEELEGEERGEEINTVDTELNVNPDEILLDIDIES